MIGEQELVGLLYRADWTRLALSGTVRGSGEVINASGFWESGKQGPPRWPAGAAVPDSPDWFFPPRGDDEGWYFQAREDDAGTEHQVSVAPGRRFRVGSPDGSRAVGSDGERIWHWRRDRPAPAAPASGFTAKVQPPFQLLLAPWWLLNGYSLVLDEEVTVGGRAGIRVLASPWSALERRGGFDLGPLTLPIGPMPRWLQDQAWDEIDAVVDAELGILLRCTRRARHQAPDVTEFLSLDVGGPAPADSFQAPAGSTFAGGGPWPAAGPLGTAGKEVAKAVAGIAAGGLGALIKFAPSRRPDPFATATAEADPDPEAGMPAGEPAPGEPGQEQPVSEAVLLAVHRGGSVTPRLTAVLHQWVAPAALLAAVPAGARRAGFGGVGFLVDAVRDQLGEDGKVSAHKVSTVTMGSWTEYRIDVTRYPQGAGARRFRPGGDKADGPRTLASDGVQQWRVYAGRVTTGPAGRVPGDIGDLLDASWLLEAELFDGAETVAGGRRAYRVTARARETTGTWSRLFLPAVALVDAENGWLLRLTTFKGGQAAQRHELRDIGEVAPGTEFGFTPPAGMPVTDEGERPPPPR
jgi:hypothetical protein